MRWGWGVDVTSQACSNEPFPPLLFLKISKIICLYPLTINVQTPHVPTFWVNLLRINDQPLHPNPHPPTPPCKKEKVYSRTNRSSDKRTPSCCLRNPKVSDRVSLEEWVAKTWIVERKCFCNWFEKNCGLFKNYRKIPLWSLNKSKVIF